MEIRCRFNAHFCSVSITGLNFNIVYLGQRRVQGLIPFLGGQKYLFQYQNCTQRLQKKFCSPPIIQPLERERTEYLIITKERLFLISSPIPPIRAFFYQGQKHTSPFLHMTQVNSNEFMMIFIFLVNVYLFLFTIHYYFFIYTFSSIFCVMFLMQLTNLKQREKNQAGFKQKWFYLIHSSTCFHYTVM